VEKPISARATEFEKSDVAGFNQPAKLSVVIPCYNEEKTLEACVDRVVAIADDTLNLEIIIVE
jgi:cellulose synthase/poly-beta-1,6-N-acetylglucosamine synthase-like glycosyltransferase